MTRSSTERKGRTVPEHTTDPTDFDILAGRVAGVAPMAKQTLDSPYMRSPTSSTARSATSCTTSAVSPTCRPRSRKRKSSTGR